MQNETQDTRADYEIAQTEAKALFDSLDIGTQATSPVGGVKDNWPCILYTFQFTKDGKTVSTEYRLGVGHVNWKKVITASSFVHGLTVDQESMVYAVQTNPNATFKNKELHASTAAQLARKQKVSPAPHEVLAAICDDALSAHGDSWENYADNFGMDKDSIKGKAVYDYCCALYHQIAALIGSENVRKFAELRTRF